MNPAQDALNTAAAAHFAARETRERAEQTTAKLKAERDAQAAAYAAQHAAVDAAIEASLADPSVAIPNVDRAALDLAERRLAAAERVLTARQAAETSARAALATAQAAYECELAIETAKAVRAAFTQVKGLQQLLALDKLEHVGPALHDQGLHAMVTALRNVLPRNESSPAEACANALSPRAAPAALKHYRDQIAAADAEREHIRRLAQADLDYQKRQAENAAAAFHESEARNLPPAMRKAADDSLSKKLKRIASDFAERRARV